MATLFFSYSRADEKLRDQLETQLAILKRQGIIEMWHDRRIGAGAEFARNIDQHVETDDIILLLVSPDFLASDYCYEKEMLRAMARHESGEAIVIPVILRPCDWQGTPFGKLNATPTDGKPVTKHSDFDDAFLEVTKAVRAAAARLARSKPDTRPVARPHPSQSHLAAAPNPRSSNLRVAKEFSERDLNQFRDDSFEYMAKFFENSLHELEMRNPGIEVDFRRIDARRFAAAVYKHGKSISRCTVFIGDRFASGGIAFVAGETFESTSFNENLMIEADDQSMYLRSLGMARGDTKKLSQEGAAEFYWSMLVERLQTR